MPTLIIKQASDWRVRLQAQKDKIRTGQYTRLGILDALCFEVTKLSNPKMLELGAQKTPDGRMAWPGKNLDWLGKGPTIAISGDSLEMLLPASPFPLPPPCPDPTFKWAKEGDLPAFIPQRIEDRAVQVKGTSLLLIQPVTQIQWMLDYAATGHARREVHEVVADPDGIHMAFLYDYDQKRGYLLGGKVI